MASTRLWLRLLALVVIADLAAVLFAHAPNPVVLLPPLLGSALASLACWSDAASSRRRRLLALLASAVTASLLWGLVLALDAGLTLQSLLLAALAGASVMLCIHSWRVAGRRRLRAHGYYMPDPAPRSGLRFPSQPDSIRNSRVPRPAQSRARRVS